MRHKIANARRLIGVALCLLIAGSHVAAEDIDLFTGVNPAGGDTPTVLLYMHNKRNTNASVTHGCTYDDGSGTPALGDTVGGFEQCAIVNALLSIKTNAQLLGKIKLGILLFNNGQFSGFENGSNGAITNGAGECGYLAYVPTVLDASGIDAIVASMKSYSSNAFLVPNLAVGDGMASAWAILNGLTDTCGGNNIDYSSLAPSAANCGDAAIVHIGNLAKTTAKIEDSTPTGRVDALLRTQLTDKFGYSTGSDEYQRFTADIPVTGINSSQDKYQSDDWARFMKRVNVDDSVQNDRNVTTYSVGVYDASVQSQIQDQFNFMGSLADQGGGKFFTVEHTAADVMKEVLLQIFTEVQAVNSVFSSATLPVSASTQGTFLNQVYIATFRPDRFAGPRWYGNLKQYKFGFDSSGKIVLADKNQPTENAVSATNPNTGGFSDSAHSFWTTNDPDPNVTTEWPSTTGYWINAPDGEADTQDGPDGDLVEKGGAAQMARIDYLTSQASRNVLSCGSTTTCSADSGNFKAFTSANFDEATLGLTGGGSTAGSPVATIGANLSNVVVNYACSPGSGNGRNRVPPRCTFYQDSSSTVDLPAFFLGSGNGGNRIASDTIGMSSGDVTFPECTLSSRCELYRQGVQDFDADGTDEPFFELEFSDASFISASSAYQQITLTSLRVHSARATVTQSAHGYDPGDVVTLNSCATNSGGTHINAQILANGTTFQESVVSRTTDSFTVAISGGDVALSTGITCGGGSVSSLTAANLIDWVRGEDNIGNEVLEGPCPLQNDGSRVDNGGQPCTYSARPSIHGDVLHSRPAVINFGDVDSDGEEDVILFYGSNDGMYRAVNGNQTRSIGSVRAGGELWSFIAPEFFTKLPRLFRNTPRVAYPGIPDDEATRRDYFFDGSTAFLQDQRATGDTAGKVYLFLTPRRGGKFIYALNVTDPTAPKFLWKKAKSDFAEFGQLWSTPQVVTIEGHTRPVLIFGAGYDADVEDLDPAGIQINADNTTTTIATDEGRGIVIIDAHTGDLVWAVVKDCTVLSAADQTKCQSNTNMSRSFAADVKVFDNDFDGFIDRLYASDTAANIWRVDIPASFSSPSDFGVSKFASLGGSGNNARKLLFPPEVVPAAPYDIVVAVAGDREKPLYDSRTTAGTAYNVDNRFYLMLDRNSGSTVATGTTTLTESDLLDRTGFKCFDPGSATLSIVDCSYDETDERYENSGGNPVELVSLAQIASVDDGYYITLEGNAGGTAGDSEGEKAVNAPTVVAGTVYFATNQPPAPSSGSCDANLGVARGYAVNIFTGKATSKIYPGGGMPATATFGLVTIDGKAYPFAIGAGGETPKDPIIPDLELSGERQRTYWYYK